MDPRLRFRGCLLGGAVGDALGAPVEFMRHDEIVRRFGAGGIRDLVPAYGVPGALTDDTQMTLFTAEGLLRGQVRGCMRGITHLPSVTDHAYLRWLRTQGERAVVDVGTDGWLWSVAELHHRRAPGNTCLSALRGKTRFGEAASNTSKGCGGVMRVAPVGLFAWPGRGRPDSAERAFTLASELAGLTHGHPTGQWPAGVLAVLVLRALDDVPLFDAVTEARGLLQARPDARETLAALDAAVSLARSGARPGVDTVTHLGAGWVAEEALAMALYCALVADDFEHGVTLAVNHGGDSDSTGSIAGNLLGARLGESAIPRRWVEGVELADVVLAVADDLHAYPTWNIGEFVPGGDNERIWARYPGW